MEGGVSLGGDLDSADDNERPYAYYYPDRDLADDNAGVVALFSQLETFPPIGSGNGTPDESGGSNSLYFEQFRTAPPNSLNAPAIDPFTGDYGGNTPSYQDVYPVFLNNGDPVFTFASTRDDSYANRYDFNFWMQQASNYANATHAVFAVRMRVQKNSTNGYFRPADAGTHCHISFWDYQAGSSSRQISPVAADGNFRTHYFCVEDPLAKSKSFDGENYLSMFIWSQEGVAYDIEEVWCWLYEEGWSCGEPIHTPDSQDRAVYGDQSGGGQPELFGAWYSGDNDQSDATIETAINATTINNNPSTHRNSPWEEYGPAISDPASDYSQVPGFVSTQETVTVFMGTDGSGRVLMPHLPSQYPGIMYPAGVRGQAGERQLRLHGGHGLHLRLLRGQAVQHHHPRQRGAGDRLPVP